uniref:E3 ubiquitin/ISG15 ligase TRIM25-like n=1 Tax=Scleropages formosus TaxID=113540 RepID=A0A8C9VQI6_SCLFO
MAEGGVHLDQDRFSCSICLDLLKDPVTINCGHSYCMDCIKGHWDQEDHVGVYSCPQCRQTFILRPILGRNTILAEVLEKLKKTGLQAAPPEHCFAGPGDVVCDVCTGRKLKAFKSCLVCLVSYCETHLQPHYDSPAFKNHKLTDATGNLQEKVCSQHDKLLDVYCRTDHRCICLLCVMDEHRGHDTVSASAGRTDEQKHLKATQSEFQEGIQQREKKVQDLRQAVDSLTRSAQAAAEDTESIFTQMIRSLEKRRSELKDVIRAQEKAALSRAEGLLERLEQEIAELKRRDAEMEQLSCHVLRIWHLCDTCRSLMGTTIKREAEEAQTRNLVLPPCIPANRITARPITTSTLCLFLPDHVLCLVLSTTFADRLTLACPSTTTMDSDSASVHVDPDTLHLSPSVLRTTMTFHTQRITSISYRVSSLSVSLLDLYTLYTYPPSLWTHTALLEMSRKLFVISKPN